MIYFPEGEYVLHSEDDNTRREPQSGKTFATDSKGNNTSHGIFIHGGHFVIKGAGRDKTKLIMVTPNLPDDANVMYSSPCLFEIKHNSALGESVDVTADAAKRDKTKLIMVTPNLPDDANVMYSSPCLFEIKHNSALGESVDVTADAAKGEYTVEVSNTLGWKKGDWVCLYLKDNDPQLVAQELAPYPVEPTMTNIIEQGVQVEDFHQIASVDWVCLYLKDNDPQLVAQELAPYPVEPTMTNIIEQGVQVEDFHQIASVNGHSVTFVEPIMHAVEARWDWKVRKYPHYEEVGVTDILLRLWNLLCMPLRLGGTGKCANTRIMKRWVWRT